MATGRILKSQISVSEQVNELSLKAALLFTWMIPHTDDFGRMPGSAKKVKAIVAPMRDDITCIDVDNALNEMRDKRLIYRYKVNDELFIEMIKFEAHQQGLHKRTKSKFPGPERTDSPPETNQFPGNSGKFPSELEQEQELEKNINTETTNVVSCSEQTEFAHEPKDEVDDAVIKLILKDGTLHRVPQEKIEGWKELYRAIDVTAELKLAKAWCLSNPQKRKTKTGITRFINLWLAKANKNAPPPPDKQLQSEIKKTFCEMLPVNPINQWSQQAEKDLQARIDEDPKRKTVSFWRNFFLLVKCGNSIKQHEWHLDYLVRDQTFANILNGKRHTTEEIERYKKLKQQHVNGEEAS
jgi:hypothetical protein